MRSDSKYSPEVCFALVKKLVIYLVYYFHFGETVL